MAVNWNPSSPETAGLEWRLTDGHWSSIARSPVRALRFDSLQAATIADLQWRLRDSGTTGPEYRTLMEIFADGDELVTAAVQSAVLRPNADDGANSNISTSAWNKGPLTPGDITDLWAYIDEPVVWPVTGNFANDAVWQESVSNEPYCFWLDATPLPATARILRVRSRAVGYAFNFGGVYSNRGMGFRLRHIPSGTLWTPPGGANLLVTLYTTLAQHDYGEINPVTGLPWTPADIAEFDGGDWVVQINGSSATDTKAVLISYEMIVDYLDPENRVAVASWARPPTQGSALVTTDDLVTMPAGTANWSKPASGRFVAGLRIAHDTLTYPNAPATANARWLAGQARIDLADPVEAPPGSGFESETYTLDSVGLYRTSGGVDSRIPSILFRTSVPAIDTDSQIYAVNPDVDDARVTAGCAEVTPTQTVGQRFTAPATDTYLGISFPFECMTPTVDSTVSVEIRRVSDNVLFGAAATFTTDEFLAMPAIEAGGNMRLVVVQLPTSASLVSGTVYEARLSVAGAGALWRIPIADTDVAGAASFGGTTGRLVFNGGGTPVLDDNADLPITIAVQPDAPDTVTAKVLRRPTRYGVDCFCDAPAVETVAVHWFPQGVSGFLSTTIERIADPDPEGLGWHLVAQVDDLATSWPDEEVPRGRSVRYRMQTLVTGGGFSEYAYSGWVTPQSLGPHLIFSSNAAPELMVVYGYEPVTEFDHLDFAADELVPIDGGDFQIALIESEQRGVAGIYRLIVNFGRQPCDDTGRPIGGRVLFEPILRAARWPGVPYVCVLDDEGNRTFAHIELSRAVREMPGWRYHCTARITPLAGIPTPVDLR